MMDESILVWLNFFKQETPDLNDFLELLSNTDTYFLNHQYVTDIDNEDYDYFHPLGFLEEDVNKILSDDDITSYYKTRLAIAIFNGVKIDKFVKKLGSKEYLKLLELVFIYGRYDKYAIAPEKLIHIMITKNELPKDLIFDFSFIRGVESIKFVD